MMKKYRNILLVEAERFDGSFDMESQYGMICGTDSDGIKFRIMKSPAGKMGKIKVGDWIVTTGEGLFWPIPDKTFRKCYVPVEGDYEDE